MNNRLTDEQIDAIAARRQAVKDAKGFTEMYDAISYSYADIDALLADNAALRQELAQARRMPAVNPAAGQDGD